MNTQKVATLSLVIAAGTGIVVGGAIMAITELQQHAERDVASSINPDYNDDNYDAQWAKKQDHINASQDAVELQGVGAAIFNFGALSALGLGVVYASRRVNQITNVQVTK